MIRPVYAVLLLASGLGGFASQAAALTIRTAGAGDPTLAPATYSYSAVVQGTTDQYYFTEITDAGSAYHPITGSVSGGRAVTVGGILRQLAAQANASVSDDHLGTVKASVRSTNDGAKAISALYFSFSLVGPAADYIPVTISAYGSTHLSPGPGGFATADATMIVNNINPVSQVREGGIFDVSSYEHQPLSTVINVKPNVGSRNGAPSIYLQATAQAGITDSTVTTEPGYYGGVVDSFVDPLISIADPELAALYTVVVSLSSVPNVSAVPLPAAAPLFGAALLALGAFSCVSRGRKRSAGETSREPAVAGPLSASRA